MSNAFSNPTIFAKEAIRHLKNNLVVGNTIHTGYKEEWSKQHNGYKPGQSITLDLPHYFRVKDGATVDVVDLVSRSTTMTLNYRKHVAWQLSSEEMTYNIDKYSEKYIMPAMQALANYVDLTCLGQYKNIPNQVGTPGTTPSNFFTIGQAAARLTEEAAPMDNRTCVLNPQATLKIADNIKGVFHREMVGTAIQRAMLPQIAGMQTLESNNVNTHTNGTWAGGTVYVDGAASNGDNTLGLDQNGAGSALTVKDGDYFTIANVNSVNPISGQSTGQARGFVADGDQTFADAGGGDYQLAAATVLPGTSPYGLYDSTANETYLPYQNVDTLPANNALVTVAGSSGQQYPVNMAYHKDCIALAMVPLEIPLSSVWSARETMDGVSVRIVRYFDGANDIEVIRFDILFAVEVINPMLGCRIAG